MSRSLPIEEKGREGKGREGIVVTSQHYQTPRVAG